MEPPVGKVFTRGRSHAGLQTTDALLLRRVAFGRFVFGKLEVVVGHDFCKLFAAGFCGPAKFLLGL